MSGLPSGRGVVSKSADVGSTSGEKTHRRAVSLGPRGGERPRGRLFDLALDSLPHLIQVGRGRDAVGRQPPVHDANRIAGRLRLPLRRRLVEPLVVGQRMRVRPDDLGVDERRTLTGASVSDGLPHHPEALGEVGAVDGEDLKGGERPHDPGDVATGGGHLLRDRDGVPVVLHEIDDGQPLAAGRIERLPELAFRRRALTERDVDDFVGVLARVTAGDVRQPLIQPAGLGAADRLQALRAGRAPLGDDVQALVAPVRRHLPAARRRVVARTHRLEQHLVRRHAEREAEGPIAVVGEEPVVGRAQRERGRHQHGLVPGAADLEEDAALVLELDFLVVQLPRQEHPAVGREPNVRRQRHAVCIADQGRGFHAAIRSGQKPAETWVISLYLTAGCRLLALGSRLWAVSRVSQEERCRSPFGAGGRYAAPQGSARAKRKPAPTVRPGRGRFALFDRLRAPRATSRGEAADPRRGVRSGVAATTGAVRENCGIHGPG